MDSRMLCIFMYIYNVPNRNFICTVNNHDVFQNCMCFLAAAGLNQCWKPFNTCSWNMFLLEWEILPCQGSFKVLYEEMPLIKSQRSMKTLPACICSMVLTCVNPGLDRRVVFAIKHNCPELSRGKPRWCVQCLQKLANWSISSNLDCCRFPARFTRPP